ncbi:MAG: HD domain-containing protein [Planctomycetota bacterium]|jgi:exopolyphosphatase/guanosine-5'-triphosphate,3'-diphosphate pyrophosphatase|nr:HD domain-containing protein [Planctomycetota bacterium]
MAVKPKNTTGEDKPARAKTPRKRTPRRKPAPPPELVAGIDIGSTAARMAVAEMSPDTGIRMIEELNQPVSTGADTYRHGRILPETLRSICRVMENFLILLDDYGVEHRRAVASSSVREADNREIVIDRIRHETGVELEILDAFEESRLAYRALQPWLGKNPHGYSLALNLGGGSTEIMLLRGGDLQVGGARRLGTSRLFHAIGRGSSHGKGEILKTLTANIVNSTREVYQEYHAAQFMLINRVLYRAFRSDPRAERHEADFVLPADYLRERLKNAYTLGNLEIGELFNFGLSDVEVLVPAMLILDCFLDATDVREITFTNTDMLTGLLAEMALAVRGEKPIMAFHRQIVRSARAVGEKFTYDRAHSRAVTEYSLRIFETMADDLDLDDHDRLLLEVAAVLHDIGMYIAERRHHQHSSYLVKWSDIVGLNEADRMLVAQIVYFHREELPSADHAQFMALSPDDRMRVRKLAGILRLADVIDRGHRQSVKELRVERTDERLYLHLQTTGDIGIIADALPAKADLLEDVCGLKVVIRREVRV